MQALSCSTRPTVDAWDCIQKMLQHTLIKARKSNPHTNCYSPCSSRPVHQPGQHSLRQAPPQHARPWPSPCGGGPLPRAPWELSTIILVVTLSKVWMRSSMYSMAMQSVCITQYNSFILVVFPGVNIQAFWLLVCSMQWESRLWDFPTCSHLERLVCQVSGIMISKLYFNQSNTNLQHQQRWESRSAIPGIFWTICHHPNSETADKGTTY